MPRRKRARHQPPKEARAPEPLSDTDHLDENGGRTRGRSRAARSTAQRLSLAEEDAIRAANRSRDAALGRLANEDATTTSGQTPGDDTRGSVEVSRRAVATPAMRRDTTGLDLADDDVFGDLEDSFTDGEIPRGGRSADSSSLTLGHVRPRSRQSSIVGRNDPPIRPSSRGPNTPGVSSSFNIGLFRRRAREPSILGTTRNSEAGSEGEFEPEAESTPLNKRPRTRRSLPSEREQSPSVQAEQSSSKKRKSVEVHDASARPEETSSRGEPDVAGRDVDSDSELSVLASPSPPSPGPVRRPASPIDQDDITAPPASSDSEGGVVGAWPDIHTLAKKRRRPSVATPLRATNLSDISSPPSLTHSPNFADDKAMRQRDRPTTRRQASPKLTTADLTSLLPKRRYKRVRDPFDLCSDEEFDTADLAQDEDELSYLDARAARRRKGSRPPSRAASARPASRAAFRARSALKPKQTPVTVCQSTRSTKTYRPRSSDKENEGDDDDDDDDEGESALVPLPDDTFDAGTGGGTEAAGGALTDELKQAAKKFIEVDKWELDFEEVAEPPSPQNAR